MLAAMGVEPALAQGAVRVSLGWSTSERDVENLLNALTKVGSSLLKRHMNAGLAASAHDPEKWEPVFGKIMRKNRHHKE